MNSIRLGHNLKAILRTRGISLKRLSAKTGIPYSTLHTWQENRQPRDIVKVKQLADYLGVDLSVLIFGEESEGRIHSGLPSAEVTLAGVYEVILRRKG